MKGLCSFHPDGTHEQHVETRLEGYARSKPRKLEKILDEIEKRRRAQKYRKQPFGPVPTCVSQHRSNSDLGIWRNKVKAVLSRGNIPVNVENAIDDSDVEELPAHDQVSRDQHDLSPLETLPGEILDQIFSYVTVDHTADPYARGQTDLCSCALSCKSLHAAAVRVMYRHVSIPQSKAFTKYLRSLTEDPQLGQLTHWLDFSHYSNMGFGRARSTSTRTPFVTPATIKECLDRLPQLQAFLVHEHVDDELDINVISTLFELPSMQALDFTACSSRAFTDAFTEACTATSWIDRRTTTLNSFSLPLKSLSLHECTTLQEPVFEMLLPRLTHLTHLDVAHTLINDQALLSIPLTAKITHLNLERCTRLTGSAVVKFLTSHPAAKDTMVYLNIMADVSRHRLLSSTDVSKLLPKLPWTLRSLNIGGARVESTHIPCLQGLATHLEELGLKGAELSVSTDISRIFGMSDEESKPNTQTTIRYIDLTDVKSATQFSLSYSPSALTTPASEPLEVIEVNSPVLEEIKRRNKHVKSPDWVVRELGRRGWYVRQPTGDGKLDDGSRSWKMGARWWGMRKIPMVEQDVGGMYGYFMFKRN